MGHSQPPVDGTLSDLIGSLEGSTVDVELFVRSLAPYPTRETQERLIDRLERLNSVGDLDSISIRVWGDAIRTDGAVARASDGETVVDRITEFFAHAADSACSISRYFRVVSERGEGGAAGRRIAPPRRCLSVRRDGELVALFPCDVDDRRYKPEDALAYLEREHAGRALGPSLGD